jgi:hypothetical protein
MFTGYILDVKQLLTGFSIKYPSQRNLLRWEGRSQRGTSRGGPTLSASADAWASADNGSKIVHTVFIFMVFAQFRSSSSPLKL